MNMPAHVILISPHGEVETYRVSNDTLSAVWELLQQDSTQESKLGKPAAAVIPVGPYMDKARHNIEDVGEIPEQAPEDTVVRSLPDPQPKTEVPTKPGPTGDAAFAQSLATLMAI